MNYFPQDSTMGIRTHVNGFLKMEYRGEDRSLLEEDGIDWDKGVFF